MQCSESNLTHPHARQMPSPQTTSPGPVTDSLKRSGPEIQSHKQMCSLGPSPPPASLPQAPSPSEALVGSGLCKAAPSFLCTPSLGAELVVVVSCSNASNHTKGPGGGELGACGGGGARCTPTWLWSVSAGETCPGTRRAMAGNHAALLVLGGTRGTSGVLRRMG